MNELGAYDIMDNLTHQDILQIIMRIELNSFLGSNGAAAMSTFFILIETNCFLALLHLWVMLIIHAHQIVLCKIFKDTCSWKL